MIVFNTDKKERKFFAKFINFILSKIFENLIIIFCVLLLSYIIQNILPVDPICYIHPNCLSLTQEQKENLLHAYKWKFFDWILGFAKGNMGTSIYANLPVSLVLAKYGLNSLILFILCIIIYIFIGTNFVLLYSTKLIKISESNKYSNVNKSKIRKVFFYLPSNLANFIFNLPMIIVFYSFLKVGKIIFTESLFFRYFLASILICISNGILIRSIKISIIDMKIASCSESFNLGKQFFGEKFFRYKYIFRTGLISFIRESFFATRHILGFTFIAEIIFSLPGIGKLLFFSFLSKDLPLIFASLIVSSLILIFGSFIIDVTIFFLSAGRSINLPKSIINETPNTKLTVADIKSVGFIFFITLMLILSRKELYFFNEISIEPSLFHPLGTDDMGRDILIKIAKSFTNTLTVSASVGIIMLLSVCTSIIGALKKTIEILLYLSVKILGSFPTLILFIAIQTIMGNNIYAYVLSISLIYMPETIFSTLKRAKEISKMDFMQNYIFTKSKVKSLFRNMKFYVPAYVKEIIIFTFIFETNIGYLKLVPLENSFGKTLSESVKYLLIGGEGIIYELVPSLLIFFILIYFLS